MFDFSWKITAVLLGLSVMASADQLPLQIDDLGPEKPSSFAHLLKVNFTNEKYNYVDLARVLGTAKLWVDGKPVNAETSEPPLGQPVPPLGSKTGCLALESYASIPTGKHRIQLKTSPEFGSLESNILKLNSSGPLQAASQDFRTRKQEVDNLVKKLDPDMSRACVELWFNRRDGGVQSPHRIRYYVNPEIKVEVPYDDTGGPGSPENLVNDRVKVYRESRILD